MTERSIAYMPLDEIPRALRNPKQHGGTVIRESIDRLGFIEPITLDERTGRLVSGHGRLDDLTARFEAGDEVPDGVLVDDDGRWRAPVVRGWRSKDDDDAARAVIILNRAVEVGGWDPSMLAAMLTDLHESVGGLTATGYPIESLDALLSDLAPPEFKPENDVPPRLDSRNPIVCPACNHHFFRA